MIVSRNKVLLFAVVLVCVLAAAVVYGYVRMNGTPSNEQRITYKDPQLTEEQKKVFLDKIAKSEAELTEFSSESKKEDVYQRYLAIASNYVPLGEFAKAQAWYLKAGKLLPQYPLPWYAVAVVESDMREYSSAEMHIDKAIALDPANPEYWRFKIDLKKSLGADAETMEALFAEAQKSTSDHVDILTVHAKYLGDQDNIVPAVKLWRAAIEKNPEARASYEAEIKKLQQKVQ